MAITADMLTVEDFTSSGWEQVIASCEEHTCSCYSTQFGRKYQETESAGDAKTACLFWLLGSITSMYLKPNDSAEPFGPMAQFSDGRTPIPSDFVEAELAYLAEILPAVTAPELEARIADILWLRKRSFPHAQTAVKAYLNTVPSTNLMENWPHATHNIERAFELSARLNNAELVSAVTATINALLLGVDVNAPNPSFLPAKLMILLQKQKQGDVVQYSILALALAEQAESEHDWHKAREYWDVAASWYQMVKDAERTKAAHIRSAETLIKEAEERGNGSDPGYMVAVLLLQQAIQVLRKIGGQHERAQQLHQEMLSYQQKSVVQMKSVSHTFDATELVKHAIGAVKGKSLYDALFTLAILAKSPSVTQIKAQVEEHRKISVLSQLFTSYTVNEMGRTVARNEPSDPGDTNEARLRADMCRNMAIARNIQGVGYIEPAREQINLEHNVRVDDFLRIVNNNPFVPARREMFFARGLYAGMQGDFVVAAHLLIPQIENSIRYILSQLNVIASGLDDEGIQNEKDLNTTLKLSPFVEALTEALGEDTLFDLRSLLVERHGGNLRNDMAHGLLSYNNFQSYSCVHLWWLTLRLCCTVHINALAEQQDEQPIPETPPDDYQPEN